MKTMTKVISVLIALSLLTTTTIKPSWAFDEVKDKQNEVTKDAKELEKEKKELEDAERRKAEEEKKKEEEDKKKAEEEKKKKEEEAEKKELENLDKEQERIDKEREDIERKKNKLASDDQTLTITANPMGLLLHNMLGISPLGFNSVAAEFMLADGFALGAEVGLFSLNLGMAGSGNINYFTMQIRDLLTISAMANYYVAGLKRFEGLYLGLSVTYTNVGWLYREWDSAQTEPYDASNATYGEKTKGIPAIAIGLNIGVKIPIAKYIMLDIFIRHAGIAYALPEMPAAGTYEPLTPMECASCAQNDASTYGSRRLQPFGSIGVGIGFVF